MPNSYRICTRCIMDTTDTEIQFDQNGVCNHCREYDRKARKLISSPEESERKLNQIAEKIKEKGKNNKYNCILGLSGGIDSTYTAYLVGKLGLKPLVVNVDNHWHTEISIRNVQNAAKKLNFDLYTHVLDWDEFRDVQLAYLKASVLDIEVISDHVTNAALYNIASEKGIKYIILGTNTATEAIMPKSWNYNKNDLGNLKDIHKQFGTVKLRTFPTLSLNQELYAQYVKKIKPVLLLDYVLYSKEDAKKIITRELDWEDYGGKHLESIWTRFYQSYILPRKFNIDKRKAHLSALICAGQITREEALKEMEKPLYTEDALNKEKGYVLKKLEMSEEEFEELMNLPIRSHFEFKSDIRWRNILRFGYRILEYMRG